MAIKFSGEFEVKKNPEEVYDFLTDPNRFAPLLPEFQSLIVQDATHFSRQGERGHFLHQGQRGREDGTVGGRPPAPRAI